jgi:hypothetical protein
MNRKRLTCFLLVFCSIISSNLVSAQTTAPPPQGSKTFSPYTPSQIQQFNQQTISPEQGPFGPVNPSERRPQKPRFDSQYFNVPVGEQEAEAIETQSAEPYEPIPATIRF